MNFTSSSVVTTWSAKVVVTAVETTGDCIKLSIATNTFGFWFVDVNVCATPTPTDVRSRTFGIDLNAFSALLARLIVLSLTLTTNNPVCGNNVVVTPVEGNVVWAIPIDCVLPIPAQKYSIFSPLT